MGAAPITSLAGLAATFVGLVNTLIPVLASIALVIFFVGIVRYVYEAGDSKGKIKGRDFMVWGLVALFVLVSLWGILDVMCTVFLGNSCFKSNWGSYGSYSTGTSDNTTGVDGYIGPGYVNNNPYGGPH